MKTRRSLIAAVLAGLVLSACGGDGGGSASDTEDPDTAAAGGDTETDDQMTEGGDSSNFSLEGETVEVIVPFGPGGGTDTTARAIATSLAEFLPGQPNVQVNNIEGGGSLVGSNEYELQREHDGTSIIFYATSPVLAWLSGADNVEYDLSQQTPLWALPNSKTVYARSSAGIDEPTDLADPAEPLRVPINPGDGSDEIIAIGLELLGIEYESFAGFAESSEQALALEQGEVNVNHWSSLNLLREVTPLLESGEANVVYTHGLVRGGEVIRDPAFPDAPTLPEVYEQLHGSEPSGDLWEAYKLVSDIIGNGAYSVFMHGDAPEGAAEVYRQAFADLTEDPEFLEEFGDTIFGPYEPLTGEAVAAWQDSLKIESEERQAGLDAYIERLND